MMLLSARVFFSHGSEAALAGFLDLLMRPVSIIRGRYDFRNHCSIGGAPLPLVTLYRQEKGRMRSLEEEEALAWVVL
jgi:hypothetical protein